MPENSPKEPTFLGPISVVELGNRAGVGALGGLLSQLGAQTIVIELPQLQTTGKWRNRPVMMAGKRSIVLDYSSSQGADDLERLIDAADVLLLSSDVDAEQRRLWDSSRSKELIVCDMTAFGHSGPLANKTASDSIVQAMSGVVDTTGPMDHPPTAIGTPILEMHAAVLAAAAIFAALRVRRMHGFGQRIDIALFDVGVTALINFVPLHLAGKYAGRAGNRHPLYAPWGAYRAKDGWILICAPMDEHWLRVCEAMGRPDLAKDPRFATMSARLENFRLIDELVSAWTAGLTAEECERQLTKLGVACGPIVEINKLDQQPNIVYRGGVKNVRDPDSDSVVKIPASPLRGAPIGGITPDFIPVRDADRESILGSLVPRKRSRVERDRGVSVRPYDGIRIIEVGQYTVAPMAARIMGAMGADVIKVEPPTGDAVRKAAPLRDDGESYIFAMSNTDKRGVVLDLRDAEDRETLHALLDKADALIENLKPGSLAKLGFDSESIRRRHPKLIFCSVNGFGTDSIYPGRPALDTVVQAMSGIMNLTHVDDVPMKAGISVSDNLGGQFSLLALVAGIELRERTGIAVHFDLSMQETSEWATQLAWNDSPEEPETAILRASDGFVAVAAAREAVEAHLAARQISSERQTRSQLVDVLSPVFMSAPVLTVGEVVDHPHTSGRGLLLTCTTAENDSWLVFSTPFRLLATPPEVKSVISRLGIGGERILRELKVGTRVGTVKSELASRRQGISEKT
jgi:crotonobetainyl-CoA:carnitine CoA-transferase CaiB-like acyl-CoA transferase